MTRRDQAHRRAFRGYFPADRVQANRPVDGERGFRLLRNRMARTFGLLVRGRHRSRGLFQGQGSGQADELPVNHSPHFAPIIHPTLRNRRSRPWSSARSRGWAQTDGFVSSAVKRRVAGVATCILNWEFKMSVPSGGGEVMDLNAGAFRPYPHFDRHECLIAI